MVSVACNFGDILSLGRSRKLAKSGGLALQDDGIRASWSLIFCCAQFNHWPQLMTRPCTENGPILKPMTCMLTLWPRDGCWRGAGPELETEIWSGWKKVPKVVHSWVEGDLEHTHHIFLEVDGAKILKVTSVQPAFIVCLNGPQFWFDKIYDIIDIWLLSMFPSL